jgi:hypothetical protein
MKNNDFLDMLHGHVTADGKKWTVGRLATAIGSNRAHVNSVLTNAPGRGYQTRRKLVKLFIREFPGMWRAMVASLNWTESGEIVPQNVPRGTLDVVQNAIPETAARWNWR